MTRKPWVGALSIMFGIGFIVWLIFFVFNESIFPHGTFAVDISLLPTQTSEGHISFTLEELALWSTEQGWERVSIDGTPSLSSDPSQAKQTIFLSDKVPVGSYDQLRMTLSSVTYTDATGSSSKAAMFNETVIISLPNVLYEDEVSSTNIVLRSPESLYTSDHGRVFVPFFSAESRTHTRLQDERVISGSILANQTFGATAAGSFRTQYRLPTNTQIQIEDGVLFVPEQEKVLLKRFTELLEEEKETLSTTSDDILATTSTSSEGLEFFDEE